MTARKDTLTIMTIMGTRPEIIRLSRIIPRLDTISNHVTVFTKQSYDYELSDVFFTELGLRKPDILLDVAAGTLGKQIGNVFSQVEDAIIKVKPDAVVVLGDTNSALSAVLAKRMGITVFHLEAGNRSFDERVPEEINRRIIDHVSDYNLAYTEHSKQYLLREGIHPATIFVIGSPLTEVFAHYRDRIALSTILDTLNLKKSAYFVASAHRQENVDTKEKLQQLCDSLESLSSVYTFPVVLSLHPRTKKRLEEFGIRLGPSIIVSKPLGFFDYNKLQQNSFCAISDSGTIQEESAILQFPAVQVRVSSERPEAFDAGSIVVCGLHHDAVVHAVETVTGLRNEGIPIGIPDDYTNPYTSVKVANIILGQTYIRKYHDFRIQSV